MPQRWFKLPLTHRSEVTFFFCVGFIPKNKMADLLTSPCRENPLCMLWQEEDIPELEIDMDELLDLSDAEQRAKLHDLLQDCDKPKEDFIDGLLYRMKGLRKMSLKK
uniref:protein phosphatase 1 regulatory subunit 14B-like isoform X2 n=1 Tax=Oncorhynchus gorbuscha TaxID=8017 RepID=UPI001EAF8320|nr:protein phosphatase 1 regulatory subunit 14B-like isoform X2 [Oncorhynchus gorbuscha]